MMMKLKTVRIKSFLTKLILLSVFGWIIPQLALAQEMLNLSDENGKKTGLWKGFYQDGSLRYEGSFLNDRPQGIFRYYDESGRLKATNSFDHTGRKAWHRAFDSTGFLLAEGIYLNQKKDSVWTYYSAADSAVIAREAYQFDQKHGLSVTYYPQSGQPAEELFYENGKLQGVWNKYFDVGTLMTSGFYENDKLNGPFTTYHPNGQVSISGQYENDLQYGIWEFFDEDGNLINTEKYKIRE